MKLPVQLDTTLWAKAQERVFAGEALPETTRRYKYLLYTQEDICPSNLTIRDRLIRSTEFRTYPPLSPLSNSIDNDLNHALHQFRSLHKAGYWAEGYSYWQYVKVGLDWYNKRHGLPVDILEAMERIDASYAALLPCPLPEVGDMGFPEDGPDLVSTPNYFCKRWRNPDGSIRAYLLIALNADPEPRANLHHHLEAGYFAFGKEVESRIGLSPDPLRGPDHYESVWKFQWLHRCKPYTTFDFKESLTSAALAACLSAGAMPPTWRVKPPKVTAKRNDLFGVGVFRDNKGVEQPHLTRFTFTWNNGLLSKQTRTIEVLPGKVIVTDGGLFRKSKTREWEV